MSDSPPSRVDYNMNSVGPYTCTSTLSVDGRCQVTCDRVPNGVRTGMVPQHLHGHDVKLAAEAKAPIATPTSPDQHNHCGSGGYTMLKSPAKTEDQSSGQERSDHSQDPGEKKDDMISDGGPDDYDDDFLSFLPQRACLVKLYAYLKEEMTRAGARAVAGYLYHHKDRLLSLPDNESICHCNKRRQAVEQLLKKVLLGPPSMFLIFVEALQQKEEAHLAQKILATQLTEEEIRVFAQLENFAQNRCDTRPNHQLPRFNLSSSDYDTLVYYLNSKTTLDCLNDKFLSSFLFSIREHTNINVHSMNEEGRVKQLLATMQLCEDAIFEVLCQGLLEQSLPNVLEKLEKPLPGSVNVRQRRKRSRCGDNEASTSQDSSTKKQRVSEDVEFRAVSSAANPDSELRQHARNDLGFDIEHVNKGSIVIQLTPNGPDSWQRLKDNCLSGNIKEFIPKVYSTDEVKDLLKEGEYRLEFTIYTLPASVQDQKKVMFHLQTETDKQEVAAKAKEVESNENLIEENMDLLVEELEISKELLSLLKKEEIVSESIKEDLDKQGGRAKKNKYLLKKIAEHGRKGYDILKSFIEEDNEDLYKELVTKETLTSLGDKLPEAAKVTKKSAPCTVTSTNSHKRELFFKGTIVLKVQKKALVPSKENVDPSSGTSKIEVSCPEILDPVCYFTEMPDSSVQSKAGELTMVLEEAWSTVGEPTPPREIKIGKRKLGDQKSEGSKKKQHGQEDSESEEDQDLIRARRQLHPKTKHENKIDKKQDGGDRGTESKDPG